MALPSKIALHIVTPFQAFEYEVDEIVLPGSEGEFGVLPGHTPFFAGLQSGQMWYRQGPDKHYLAVSIGFAEVLPDRVTVVAQVAQRAESLDVAGAEEGMRRAEETLGASVPVEIDFERARLAMLRTLQQMQAEGRRS